MENMLNWEEPEVKIRGWEGYVVKQSKEKKSQGNEKKGETGGECKWA